MSLYIEIFDGLEKLAMMHLIQIADQTNDLSFSSTSYQYPSSPSSKFISVNFNPTNWFAKGDILNSVTNNYTLNGNVLIAPRAPNDTVLLQDGNEPFLKDIVGITEFYNNSITGGWDALIYYDVTSSGSKNSPINYVTKDIAANCIFSPSHVILYHELFHAGHTVTVPIPEDAKDLYESLALGAENSYRAYLGLPLRGDTQVFNEQEATSRGYCSS